MTNIAGDLFDDLPKVCPGCGEYDCPAENGPSKLMLFWQWRLSTYLCTSCNRNYTEWIGKQWLDEENIERNKPKCIRNIEAIAKGEPPDYKPWVYANPMGTAQQP